MDDGQIVTVATRRRGGEEGRRNGGEGDLLDGGGDGGKGRNGGGGADFIGFCAPVFGERNWIGDVQLGREHKGSRDLDLCAWVLVWGGSKGIETSFSRGWRGSWTIHPVPHAAKKKSQNK